MINVKYGDVINVDLNPVKGSETGKIRPCVVISHNAINRNAPVVIVAIITEWNMKKKKIPFCVDVTTELNKLYKKGVIDCGQIRTVSRAY